jgi:hypothetical protein
MNREEQHREGERLIARLHEQACLVQAAAWIGALPDPAIAIVSMVLDQVLASTDDLDEFFELGRIALDFGRHVRQFWLLVMVAKAAVRSAATVMSDQRDIRREIVLCRSSCSQIHTALFFFPTMLPRVIFYFFPTPGSCNQRETILISGSFFCWVRLTCRRFR